jgi:hypothetical protein
MRLSASMLERLAFHTRIDCLTLRQMDVHAVPCHVSLLATSRQHITHFSLPVQGIRVLRFSRLGAWTFMSHYFRPTPESIAWSGNVGPSGLRHLAVATSPGSRSSSPSKRSLISRRERTTSFADDAWYGELT